MRDREGRGEEKRGKGGGGEERMRDREGRGEEKRENER